MGQVADYPKPLTIIYKSFVRPLIDTDDEVICVGTVIRLSRDDFAELIEASKQGNVQKTEEYQYVVDPSEIVRQALDHYHTEDVELGGPIERIEVLEHGTGDILILWRVPIKK